MNTHPENHTGKPGFIARLRQLPFVPAMDAFLTSDWFLVLLGVLTVSCNALNLEFPVYTVFVIIGLYISFFGRDYLPLVPMVVCCYIAPYISNNPGAYETSIFYVGYGGGYILSLGLIFAVSVVLRLTLDPEIGQRAFFTAKRTLLPGLLALGGAYLLAGAFSGHYFDHGMGNLVFAVTQFAAIGGLYYIMAGAVRWEDAPKHYLGKTGLMLGLSLVAEIIVMYIITKPFASGELDRNALFTGWGNYNCMGGLLTMMIPFAFYMAAEQKRSWIYTLCGIAMLAGVVLSCSRTSIVIAVVIYAASLLLLCIKSKNRWSCLGINGGLFAAGMGYLLIFHFELVMSYLDIFTITRSIFSRFDGFAAGIEQFLNYPIFGGSFYPVDYPLEEWSTVENFTSFFPGLWHNTVIQMLASCGIVGMAAYSFHRIQTVRLVWKKRCIENLFAGLSLAAMLLMSLFDCHIYNIGPAMFYSMALAYMEKHPQE